MTLERISTIVFLSVTIKFSRLNVNNMEKWKCTLCDYVYDPAVGDPDGGVAPGTAFEDLPDGWVCP